MNDDRRGTDTASDTKARILRAYETLIIDSGERAATLDAVAQRAGVSKGGLLYHFANKEALLSGHLEHLDRLVADDVEHMHSAPEGAVEYFLRTSTESGGAYDDAIFATMRLAQVPEPLAAQAIESMREAWIAVLADHVGDMDLARTIGIIGEGLYTVAAFAPAGGENSPADKELASIRRVLARIDASTVVQPPTR